LMVSFHFYLFAANVMAAAVLSSNLSTTL
jgi:hypothetical protein